LVSVERFVYLRDRGIVCGSGRRCNRRILYCRLICGYSGPKTPIRAETGKRNRMRCFLLRYVSTSLLLVTLGEVAPADDLGLRVAPGFKVTLFADQDLANDIYSMTLDAEGRVVVSSRGWVKTLHDTKGTGRPDRATLFATTPKGGMGLAFDGPDLLFTGDD